MIQKGDVIQINPSKHRFFGGAFAVVDEVKGWGVIAMVPIVTENAPGHAPVRLSFDDIERIGSAMWVLGDAQEEEEG